MLFRSAEPLHLIVWPIVAKERFNLSSVTSPAVISVEVIVDFVAKAPKPKLVRAVAGTTSLKLFIGFNGTNPNALCLPKKFVKSPDDNNPRLLADAVGKFKVMFVDDELILKSTPEVPVIIFNAPVKPFKVGIGADGIATQFVFTPFVCKTFPL